MVRYRPCERKGVMPSSAYVCEPTKRSLDVPTVAVSYKCDSDHAALFRFARHIDKV